MKPETSVAEATTVALLIACFIIPMLRAVAEKYCHRKLVYLLAMIGQFSGVYYTIAFLFQTNENNFFLNTIGTVTSFVLFRQCLAMEKTLGIPPIYKKVFTFRRKEKNESYPDKRYF